MCRLQRRPEGEKAQSNCPLFIILWQVKGSRVAKPGDRLAGEKGDGDPYWVMIGLARIMDTSTPYK
jgi:hypothetical protein